MDNEKVLLDAEKKRTRAMLKVLIPITVLVVVLTVIVGFLVNKAGNKSPVTGNEFMEIAYQQGCEVSDVKDQLNRKELFENALVASIDDNNSIFFFNFKEKKDAKSYFASTARGFKSEVKKSGTDNSEQEALENYCYYTATADGKYMHVVRVKNTVLYTSVDESHTNTVKKIIGAIGY